MNITINAVRFRTDEKLEKFIHEKVGKLDRLIDNAVGCEVTLKSESDLKKVADIRINVPGSDLFVSKQAGNFEQAVSDCVDTLRVQIERYKNA
ncbi:MAG: HPF/RaiA family ribosome-associated protein [Bacteroidales bacterium]|nr:HPF/RaiA family ribosome-associated protein [Bacteroidales bacterium]